MRTRTITGVAVAATLGATLAGGIGAASAADRSGMPNRAGGLSGAPDAVAAAPEAAAAAAPAKLLSAVVDRTGQLARGSHVVNAASVGTGYYEVTFDRPVRVCTYLGTIGLPGSVGVEESGEITVVGANSGARRVFVTTTDSAGVPAPRGFHLAVFCP